MANPLVNGGKGMPVPMQGNVNAIQAIMGRLQGAQQMFARGGAGINPQQMIMNSMQKDPAAIQGIQSLREKYGMDKSATQIAQAICKEQWLDYDQMASMFSGFNNFFPTNGQRR